MPAAMTRTSGTIAGEIESRSTRRAELEQRHTAVEDDLKRLRAERARSLVDGVAGPSAKALAALVEEQGALVAALALLADDVLALQAESEKVNIAEGEQAQGEAIRAAQDALDKLEAVLRSVVASAIAVASDKYDAMMKISRRCDDDLERLRVKAGKPARLGPGRAEDILKHRTPLLILVASLRTYCDDSRRKRAE